MRTLEKTHSVIHERNRKTSVFYRAKDKAEADSVCRKECEANASQIASGDLKVYVSSVPAMLSELTHEEMMERLGFDNLQPKGEIFELNKKYISDRKDSSI